MEKENNDRFTKIDQRFDKMEKENNDRFTKIDQRFDKMEKENKNEFKNISEHFIKIEDELTRIEYDHGDKLRILVDGFNFLNEKIDRKYLEQKEKYEKHDDKIINYGARIQMLEKRKKT